MMRIDQINAVRQAEREHRVEINKMPPPKTTDSNCFKLEMPFVVSDKSLVVFAVVTVAVPTFGVRTNIGFMFAAIKFTLKYYMNII